MHNSFCVYILLYIPSALSAVQCFCCIHVMLKLQATCICIFHSHQSCQVPLINSMLINIHAAIFHITNFY